MTITKFGAALVLALMASVVSQAAFAQDVNAQSGVIELVNTSTKTIIISELPYTYDSATVLTNDENLQESNLKIQDFSPGAIVQFDSSSSSRLRYLRIFIP